MCGLRVARKTMNLDTYGAGRSETLTSRGLTPMLVNAV